MNQKGQHMDIITYSLRNQGRDSEQYYRDVATFTNEVLDAAQHSLGPLIAAFQAYQRDSGSEAPRSQPEYAFELLTLGVLWHVYAPDALHLDTRLVLTKGVHHVACKDFWQHER